MVTRLFQLLNAPSPTVSGSPLDYPSLLTQLAELIPRFFEALQDMAQRQDDDVAEMATVCDDAVAMRAALRADVPRRPWVLTAATARTAGDGIVQVIRGFLRAFSARTPLAAQRLAQDAQARLDAVSGPVADLRLLNERWDSVSEAEDLGDWLSAALLDAADAAGQPGLVGLDAVGLTAYQSVTGRTPTTGVGLGFLLHQLSVRVMGDEAAFNGALRTADAFITRRRPAFQRLLDRPEAVKELRAGMVQLGDQMAATNAAIAAARNERQTVRSVLALMHTMFEGPGRRCAALYLELVGLRTFEESLPADGAGVIHEARARGDLKGAFYGFDRSLRIAHAHQTYVVEEDKLVFREKEKTPGASRMTTVSTDELLDAFLASAECLNALCLAIQAAALELGVDVVGPDFFTSVGVGPDAILSGLLSAEGYRDITVDLEVESAHVKLSGDRLSLAAVSNTAVALPNCRDVNYSLATPDGTAEEWVVDVRALRVSETKPGGIEKEMAFQEALSATCLNGAARWPPAAVQCWVAGRAFQAVQCGIAGLAYPDVMRDLRALATFSRAHGLEDVRRAVLDLMRFWRLTDEKVGGDPAVFTVLEELSATPPSMPFI